MCKIYIDVDSEIYDIILEYLNNFTDTFYLESINEDNELDLTAHFGEYNIKVNNVDYIIKYNEEGPIVSSNYGPTRKKNLLIICTQFRDNKQNINSIKDLINEVIKEKLLKKPNDQIKVNIVNNNRWDILSKIQKRSLDTIFLDKNNIIDDINQFKSSYKDYLKRGIKYKRNYLLYGPPGTGKTSLIIGIASKYDYGIYIINFNSGVSDNIFLKLISKIPENSILVLEDIDCLFIERESKTSVSFSTVLNALDGIACKNGLITFMTTNFKNKLDSALTRPGRVDYLYEFKYSTKNQLKNMYDSYFDDNNFNSIYNKIKNKNISTAAFHKFLFENRNNENIASNIEMLYNLCEQYDQFENIYL